MFCGCQPRWRLLSTIRKHFSTPGNETVFLSNIIKCALNMVVQHALLVRFEIASADSVLGRIFSTRKKKAFEDIFSSLKIHFRD